MKSIPPVVFLQVDPEDESPEHFSDIEGVTWSSNPVNKSDVKYIRCSGVFDSNGSEINLDDSLRIEVRSYKDQKPITVYSSVVELISGQFCVKTPTGEYQWIGGFGRHCILGVVND